ncbi:unnamed protein product [marine sediment metagenome]|uniref:Uncharacterized protein n=1 Tax=marine sediment metagenome TaxID=412755 RepID=X1RKR4_9ZZZZ
MVWVNMPLGSIMFGNPGIADVIAVAKSYKTTVRIYEVKTTRGDFWGDVNKGKYLRYLENCNQFYFATEAGIVKKEEIPQGCGLITRSDKGWHVQIAAKRSDCELTTEFLIALLMRGFQDYWANANRLNHDKEYYEYKGLHDAAYKFGKRFAQDLAKGPEYLNAARELQRKVDEALGRQHGSLDLSLWALRGDVDRLLVQYKYAEEVAKLTDILMRIFQGNSYRVAEELGEIIEKLERR